MLLFYITSQIKTREFHAESNLSFRDQQSETH